MEQVGIFNCYLIILQLVIGVPNKPMLSTAEDIDDRFSRKYEDIQ